MSSLIWRHEITKNIWHNTFGLQTKYWENPIFGNPTSSDQNLTQFCKDIDFDVKKQPLKFQIDILKIDYSINQSLK